MTLDRRAGLTALGAALVVAGLATLGSAALAPAKAQLGYLLLDRAFAATLAAGGEAAPVKPWPGADIAPIARLSFPTLGQSRAVLNEASGEAMAWGAGHVVGTAQLGAPGLAAAAAHRDTHFALLGQLAPGDPIELQTRDGRRETYVVEAAHVVDSRVWRFPALFDGPKILALSTCWPLDALTPGPERLVLFARPQRDDAS